MRLVKPAPAVIPAADLRAAVALAHHRRGDADGDWPLAVWERLFERLTPRQQQVVYLHVLVGLTHAQAAEELGLTRGTVDGVWLRALARIRGAIPPRD